jgi:VWFA-related protein
MRTRSRAILAGLAVMAAAAYPAVFTQDPQPARAQVPVFRSSVTLVPVDVRVTDKNGKPVTDLRQDEFTITEDGARQDIRHFSLQTLTAEPSGAEPPAAETGLALREAAINLEPQVNRIFLIVLGRGKLQEPSRAIDALIGFVRQRLLPQDQVAVFAYNRATTFTRNHQQIARLLERFREMHEQVDFEIGLQMSGLAAIYGSRMIPRTLQAKIDQMFAGSGLLASQRVAPADAAASRVDKDALRQTDAQIQKEIEVARAAAAAAAGVPNLTVWSDIDEIQTQMFADLPLEEFVSSTAQTLQDLGNLYGAIEYLRHFEGEKHIVFFTERGLILPRLEEDEILASAANDARVAIDTVETGGIYVGQPGGEAAEGRWSQTFAFATLRRVAELTGGVSSIAEPGTTAMSRIDEVTRAGYLLGYYPSNSNWNGAYRKVAVRVSRPGVNVYYRHGYYSRKELEPFSRREFITADRIRAAASFRREIRDIRLRVDASLGKAQDAAGYEMSVAVNISAEKLAFTFVEGVHIGRISIAVFCFDEKGNAIGNSMQTADLKLKDENFQKILSAGIPYKVRFLVNPGVRRVRVVVYDFKADLIGSADKPVV